MVKASTVYKNGSRIFEKGAATVGAIPLSKSVAIDGLLTDVGLKMRNGTQQRLRAVGFGNRTDEDIKQIFDD